MDDARKPRDGTPEPRQVPESNHEATHGRGDICYVCHVFSVTLLTSPCAIERVWRGVIEDVGAWQGQLQFSTTGGLKPLQPRPQLTRRPNFSGARW